MNEPAIIINGEKLTDAQAMTLRVAVSDFLLCMSEPDALGDDEHAEQMQDGYTMHCLAILKIMYA